MKPARNRCLFNGDCNFLFASDYRREPEGPYTAGVIHDYVDLLADSGADTFVMNPNGQVPWYPSRATPSMLEGYTRGDREFIRPHYPPLDEHFSQEQLDRHLDRQVAMLDRYLDLVEQGVDWLAEVSRGCRRRGIAPWVSIRMNDAHGANNWKGSYFNCALQGDPRYRLRGRPLNPARGPRTDWQVLNYEHREVRDYMFTILRELVEDYDFEGLELDWLRMPLCCEPPASDEAVEAMLGWMAEIRELTRRRAEATGKSYPVGLRVPARLGTLRAMGLDVAAMAHRDLIDFIGPSNFWQTTWDVPYDRLREELGEDVALYGVIEDAPNWMHARGDGIDRGYRLLSASGPAMRGNAAGKLALGADGIEFFNFFCADVPRVQGAGAPGAARYDEIRGAAALHDLRGKPKFYTLATTFGNWMHPLYERAEHLPAVIESGGRRAFELSMCAEPPDAGLELVVQLAVERREEAPGLGVSFNGSWPVYEAVETDRLLFPAGRLTHHVPEHRAFNYRLPAERIREGWNEIVVMDGSDDTNYRARRLEDAIRLVGLDVGVLK